MSPSSAPDVRQIFEAHGDFVWRALARSGVRDADLRDATQEVFLVVSRKVSEREGTSSLSTWLYGIAIKVAANYRRKAHRKREELTDEVPDPVEGEVHGDPEQALANEQARVRLAQILDELPVDQRVVFMMFELEEMTCPAIAEALGIPLGTVYTRLRSGRAMFEEKAGRAAEEGP
ncbi:MAG: RNA polymerase sigma factor [Labilithrix sp.]|nr:RNA polymerase sigma factor [Labilithrix sp.]